MVSALVIAPFSHAAWSAVVLHKVGGPVSESYAVGCNATQQVGFGQGATSYEGVLWTGTANSCISLTPSGATGSTIHGCDNTQQYGAAVINGGYHAGYWSSSAASWVDVSQVGKYPSELNAGKSGVQVGYVTLSSKKHASMWSGAANSWLDLHPAGFTESEAYAVDGGTQAGYAIQSIHQQAALWTGSSGSFTNLNPNGATSSVVFALSGGQQGGIANFGGTNHAGIWSGSKASFVDLHPTGSLISWVYGMTPTTQVGYYAVVQSGAGHACYWKGTKDSRVDIHGYLPARFSSSVAHSISVGTDGTTYIAGYAYDSNLSHYEAVLWIDSAPGSFALTLNKSQVAGQNSVQGTISVPQSEASAVVFTTYDNSSLVTTPPSVTLPSGSLAKNFQITVTAVTSTINTTIYAKRGSITRSQPLALVPLIPTALAFTPSTVTGGQPTSCKVVVNGVAGPSGRAIAIIENSPYATAPSTVTVPPGGTSVTFNITTSTVTSQKSVTITARVSAGEKSGTFRINP